MENKNVIIVGDEVERDGSSYIHSKRGAYRRMRKEHVKINIPKGEQKQIVKEAVKTAIFKGILKRTDSGNYYFVTANNVAMRIENPDIIDAYGYDLSNKFIYNIPFIVIGTVDQEKNTIFIKGIGMTPEAGTLIAEHAVKNIKPAEKPEEVKKYTKNFFGFKVTGTKEQLEEAAVIGSMTLGPGMVISGLVVPALAKGVYSGVKTFWHSIF